MRKPSQNKIPITAATRVRAEHWLNLVNDDVVMTDHRWGTERVVTEPIEQWANLYHDTHLECMN